jgi:cyclohexa-1,5-dienecarbonyl-CoA hydratase
VASREEGAVRHLILDAPKANVIDAAMTGALAEAFQQAADDPQVKAVLLEGAGDHFSFGASVEEHLPEQVAGMLRAFHGLFRTMAESRLVVLAAIRGQCLGGGLELASFAHRIFAAPSARLGQPEIRLGVFAPAASVLLPERMGRAAAEDLCLTGRILSAEQAHAAGLVDELAEDPTEAALTNVRENLLAHSAASLRRAVAAVRLGLTRRLHDDLDEVERLYLEDLMATSDASEGIRAFLEKRRPTWSNA